MPWPTAHPAVFNSITTATPEDFTDLTENKNIDNELQTFRLEGICKEFKCVPNQTSNFDVFRLSNPHISDHHARTIWNYYRELSITAKLLGKPLSSYYSSLQRFLEEKSHHDREFYVNRVHSRYDSIKQYINLARYLELQYNTDTAIAQLSENTTPEQMEHSATHLLGTVPFNNYVSYFTNDISDKLKNTTDYDNRKLLVRSVYAYTHKQLRWYICGSEYGAVKLCVHTKHNAFLPMFEKLISNGVTINVVTSNIMLNIDSTVPCIKIDKFFLE